MKTTVLIIAVCLLAGCSVFNQIQNKTDADIAVYLNQVWASKDCRAAIANTVTALRPASIEAKMAAEDMLSIADTKSDEYKKCQFGADWADWFLYASKDEAGKVSDVLKLLLAK